MESVDETKYRVAIIGCGYMGQKYVEAYHTYPDTEIVAIAEHSPDRRVEIGERFGVEALYPDVHALLRDVVPDIVAVATPTKFFKEAVLACAAAGVRGVSTEKPIGAVLSDVDEMVETCESRGVVLAGGSLHRARNEVQEAARRIRGGEFGDLKGARVFGWGKQISGGGCQHISILRLFTDAEVDEVVAWTDHPAGPSSHALPGDSDVGLVVNGIFHLTNGLECPVFGAEAESQGVDVWSQEALVHFEFGPPEVFHGFDANGSRKRLDPHYDAYQWSEFGYLTGSIRSFLTAVETGSKPWISGHDLRQALEVAIASKLSADLGSAPVKLPLPDRSLSLYPSERRWVGRDQEGRPL